MQQFHLLNKTLRNIFTKLTHRACNSPLCRAKSDIFAFPALLVVPEGRSPSRLAWWQTKSVDRVDEVGQPSWPSRSTEVLQSVDRVAQVGRPRCPQSVDRVVQVGPPTMPRGSGIRPRHRLVSGDATTCIARCNAACRARERRTSPDTTPRVARCKGKCRAMQRQVSGDNTKSASANRT